MSALSGVIEAETAIRLYVQGEGSLSDLSDWIAENFWDGDVPELVRRANHLIYDLGAGLTTEDALRDELGRIVGWQRVEQLEPSPTSVGSVARIRMDPTPTIGRWVGLPTEHATA